MKRFIETVLLTFVGGVLFTLLHVPLSWMLGPMTAVVLWTTLTRRKLIWPVWLRNGGLMLLGYSMGLSFTLESSKLIVAQLPSMFFATALTILFSLMTALLTARFTGISMASSVLGSIPGGLTQMVVLSEEIEGTDAAVVAFMQTLRLLLVVFIIPFVAVHGLTGGAVRGHGAGDEPSELGMLEDLWHSLGVWGNAIADRPLITCMIAVGIAAACWAAIKLRFPTPYFLGPIIAAAAFTIYGTEPQQLPSLLVILAQWSMGIYIGMGIKLGSLGNWRRLLPYTVLSNVALIGFILALAYVFSSILPMSLITAFLAMSPGGMAEMGVTATLVGADVSVVVAYQLFRILFILFVVPYMLRWGIRLLRRTKKSSE